MITIEMNVKRLVMVAILFTIHCSLFTASAQTIKNGQKFWDGEQLYTASLDETGNMVTMTGKTKEIGGYGSFILNKERNGRYTLASDSQYGYLPVRGQVGW